MIRLIRRVSRTVANTDDDDTVGGNFVKDEIRIWRHDYAAYVWKGRAWPTSGRLASRRNMSWGRA